MVYTKIDVNVECSFTVLFEISIFLGGGENIKKIGSLFEFGDLKFSGYSFLYFMESYLRYNNS